MPRVCKFANGVHSIRNGSVIELTGKHPFKVFVTGFNKNYVLVREFGDDEDMWVFTSDLVSEIFIK